MFQEREHNAVPGAASARPMVPNSGSAVGSGSIAQQSHHFPQHSRNAHSRVPPVGHHGRLQGQPTPQPQTQFHSNQPKLGVSAAGSRIAGSGQIVSPSPPTTAISALDTNEPSVANASGASGHHFPLHHHRSAVFPAVPINDSISYSPFQPAPPVRALYSNELAPFARSPFRVKMFSAPSQQQVRLGTNGVASSQDSTPPTSSAAVGGGSRHHHIVAPKFPSTRPVGQQSPASHLDLRKPPLDGAMPVHSSVSVTGAGAHQAGAARTSGALAFVASSDPSVTTACGSSSVALSSKSGMPTRLTSSNQGPGHGRSKVSSSQSNALEEGPGHLRYARQPVLGVSAGAKSRLGAQKGVTKSEVGYWGVRYISLHSYKIMRPSDEFTEETLNSLASIIKASGTGSLNQWSVLTNNIQSSSEISMPPEHDKASQSTEPSGTDAGMISDATLRPSASNEHSKKHLTSAALFGTAMTDVDNSFHPLALSQTHAVVQQAILNAAVGTSTQQFHLNLFHWLKQAQADPTSSSLVYLRQQLRQGLLSQRQRRQQSLAAVSTAVLPLDLGETDEDRSVSAPSSRAIHHFPYQQSPKSNFETSGDDSRFRHRVPADNQYVCVDSADWFGSRLDPALLRRQISAPDPVPCTPSSSVLSPQPPPGPRLRRRLAKPRPDELILVEDDEDENMSTWSEAKGGHGYSYDTQPLKSVAHHWSGATLGQVEQDAKHVLADPDGWFRSENSTVQLQQSPGGRSEVVVFDLQTELDELAAQLTNLGSASPGPVRGVTNNALSGKSQLQPYVNGQHRASGKPDALIRSNSSGISSDQPRGRSSLSDPVAKPPRSTSASSTGSSSSSSSESISSQCSSGSVERQSPKSKAPVDSSSSASGSRSTGSRDFRSSTCSSVSSGSSNGSHSSKTHRHEKSPGSTPALDQRRLTVVENVSTQDSMGGHEYDAVGEVSGAGDENGWCDDDGADEEVENTEVSDEKHPSLGNNGEPEDGENDQRGEDEDDDDDGEVDVVEEGEVGPDLEETAQIHSPSRSATGSFATRMESDRSDKQPQGVTVGLPTSAHPVSSAERIEGKQSASQIIGVSSGPVQARTKTHVDIQLVHPLNASILPSSALTAANFSQQHSIPNVTTASGPSASNHQLPGVGEEAPEIQVYKKRFSSEILCAAMWGVNLLIGLETGLSLLDRSGEGKVYSLITRRRFSQMAVLEGQNILVTISGRKNRLRVYYLSWLRSKIMKTEGCDKKNGWVNVGENLHGAVHFKIVKYEKIKFLVVALRDSVGIYAWAPRPYHKFMDFKRFSDLAHRPLLVDLTVEENQRLKVIYGSSAGFHAIDLDSNTVFDLYLPPTNSTQITPHCIVVLPNTDGMQLLLCYDTEGVYVDTNGKLTKNVVIQWGEVPTSVAYISTGQLLGWGLKAIEVRSAETGHLDGVFMHKREQKFKFLCERNDKVFFSNTRSGPPQVSMMTLSGIHW
ncbi:Serine/threonine-protein kinase mig-15 [Fasciola gigantica]|uniref:non-specific serine/threonine protein kinase n=1 Tax=Fasciola gigantica TaxID=46835 RepID=A0A504YD28_FASGI|nr:Serine/threonine-protein kinase mig-15 [Fasciola gigantica]